MSRLGEMQAIVTTLASNATIDLARVAWDAMGGPKFVPPAIDPKTPEDSVFIRPRARTLAGTERAFWASDSTSYREGILTIEGWGPVGVGWDELGAIVESHLLIFSRQDVSNMHFGTASGLDPRGELSDGAWEQVNGYVGYSIVEAESSENPVANNVLQVTQAAHGFAVGDFVALNDSNDAWELGVADASSFNYSLGGFVSYVPNASNFTVVVGGVARITGHAKGTGRLYVSQSTAGSVSTTEVTAGVWYSPGIGLDANRIAVLPTIKDVNPRNL